MKDKQRTTNNKQRTYKAFTLIELVVAVALLAMVFAFAGVIFKVSINAYRTAVANAEIIQKLRAITDQMNADFEGVILTVGGKINFDSEYSYINGQTKLVRSDCITIFANGDFQSTRQYPSTSGDKTVAGNVAAIFYGLANTSTTNPREKILVRRQTIMTSDSSLTQHFNLIDRQEYCDRQTLANVIADPCLVDDLMLMGRPAWDPNNWDPNDVAMYMAKGVDDFTIQYVGGEDPDQGRQFNEWRPDSNDDLSSWPKHLYPKAFKFTFTLYDSKGIIKEGREFTHIVYIGD